MLKNSAKNLHCCDAHTTLIIQEILDVFCCNEQYNGMMTLFFVFVTVYFLNWIVRGLFINCNINGA